MHDEVRIDRRKFLGGSRRRGCRSVRHVGAWAKPPGRAQRPDRDQGDARDQHFSVRDATTARLDKRRRQGYLGGPNFPEDPTDLGPLVPLPGRLREVFDYLASVGYTGFEFFQYTQNAGHASARRAADQRGRSAAYLDDAGMKSFGTHTGGTGHVDQRRPRAPHSSTSPTRSGTDDRHRRRPGRRRAPNTLADRGRPPETSTTSSAS